jgi:hypothetical protein
MPRDLYAGMAKLEASYGTIETLLPASDGFLFFDLNRQPEQADVIRRRTQRPYPGAVGGKSIRRRVSHGFGVELAGAGAALTIAKWGALLRACTFGAPAVGASEVTYPLSSTIPYGALSIATYRENIRVRSRGSRGTVVFTFEEGSDPYMSFDLLGLRVAAADASAPGNVDVTAWREPMDVSTLNTTFTLDGVQPGLRSARIDVGVITEFDSAVGYEEIAIGKSDAGDARAISAEFVIRCPDLATKNYYSSINGAVVPFSLVHGAGAGNIVDLSSTLFKIESIDEGVTTGNVDLTIKGSCVPTAANNELTLKTR